MRGIICALFIDLLPVKNLSPFRPDWAFPVADKVQPPAKDDNQPKTLTGSTRSYTQKQIDDLKNPPDWFPDMHPPMPDVVARGSAIFACGSCHLPIGTGGVECAYVAGLPAPYLVQQMKDFKSGARTGFGIMPDIARALTDADVQSAAAYFSTLPARTWLRVVETDIVPKTYVNPNGMRLALPGGEMNRSVSRIVKGAGGRGGSGRARSSIRFRRLCAAGQRRQGSEAGHDRRRRDDRVHDLPRSGAPGCRYDASARGKACGLHRPPTLFLPESPCYFGPGRRADTMSCSG